MEALTSWGAENIVTTTLVTLAIAWYVANYLTNGRGQAIGGVGAAQAKDDAVRAARERQQAALTGAASAASANASRSLSAESKVPGPVPSSGTTQAMPSRMAAALARAEAAEASAAAVSVTQPPAAAKKMTAQDANSVTQRLARLEKGKGPTDHNPLQGHGSGSSAGGTFCTKKGG